MAVVLAGLLFCLSVSAQECDPVTTDPGCGVVPIQQLNYATTTQIPKFDTTLGTLLEVRMTAQACGRISAELDSEDATAQEFDISALARVIPTLPNEGDETFQIDIAETFTVQADDEPGTGNSDYAGPDWSGLFTEGTVAVPVCTDNREFVYTGAQMDPFKGAAGDQLLIPVRTQGGITVIGSVLQASRSDAFMGITICVEYTYQPECKFCINGTKTNDCTNQPISGWEICLSNSSGPITCVETDTNGEYSFCGLVPGDYQVTEETRAGWVSKDATVRDVEIVDADVDGVDFLNAPLTCISGHKFNSKTNAGLSGWTIQLKDANGALLKTTNTGAGGFYQFCGLLPGSYTVCEVQKAGWKAVGPTCFDVALEGCENVEDVDFFNEPTNLVCVCPFFIKNELYTASCKAIYEVDAAHGILANDPAGSIVLNPELITIDPKYGTIEVDEDGSFVYDPTGATGIRNGVYVMFNYAANNGLCDSRYLGLAKIQVSCK